MITYRTASLADAPTIGLLHAKSWQQHYKEVLSESYLKDYVVEDRLEVWQLRLEKPAKNQHIIVAEDKGIVCGFICLFFQENPVWGTLLDNLHVAYDWKGKGIGASLLKAGHQWSLQQDATVPMHLWVYASNKGAIAFYEKLDGRVAEKTMHHNPDGGSAVALRYVWETSKK